MKPEGQLGKEGEEKEEDYSKEENEYYPPLHVHLLPFHSLLSSFPPFVDSVCSAFSSSFQQSSSPLCAYVSSPFPCITLPFVTNQFQCHISLKLVFILIFLLLTFHSFVSLVTPFCLLVSFCIPSRVSVCFLFLLSSFPVDTVGLGCFSSSYGSSLAFPLLPRSFKIPPNLPLCFTNFIPLTFLLSTFYFFSTVPYLDFLIFLLVTFHSFLAISSP